MKDLRFRVLYEGKIYEVFSIDFYDIMVTIPLGRFPYTEKVKPEELLQYTGVNDSIGDPIYNRDILEYTDNEGSKAILNVMWANHSWAVKSKTWGVEYFCDLITIIEDESQSIIKIGNGYEYKK